MEDRARENGAAAERNGSPVFNVRVALPTFKFGITIQNTNTGI
jgi:hypothetical protein